MPSPPSTFATALFANARSTAPAFVFRDARVLEFGQVSEIVGTMAAGLLAHGLQPGSRIAFLVPRGPLGVIGFLAVSSIGICCPLSPRLTSAELTASLTNMSVAALLNGDSQHTASALAAKLGVRYLDVTLDENGVRVDGIVPSITAPLSADLSPTALLMQTSGTTSRPKVVALTHTNIIAAASAIGRTFQLGPHDCCFNPMPLHHVHGLISAALSSLLAGSAVYCAGGFSPAEFDVVNRALAPTWFTASPTVHLALREHYEQAGTVPPRCFRFFRSSSAPLPASAIDALEALFQAPLIEAYGLTETASVVCANPLPPAIRKAGSVGLPSGAEIKIIDTDGRPCAAGEEGQITIRDPSTITAYAHGEAEDSFLDGWLSTGDLGRMDEDGYLYVVGRLKEVIKRGALPVYPSEVDDVLLAHGAVAEATTFGIRHPTLGEDVAAAVVLRAGAHVTEAVLRQHIATQLSSYKVPSVILIVPLIPRNDIGKVVRGQMAANFPELLVPKGEAPSDPTEKTLLAVWLGVLERHDIGVTDNVFVFGADPLRAERAAREIAAEGWTPTLKELLAAPTVREQAAIARQLQPIRA